MPKVLGQDETQINFRIPIDKKNAFIEKAKANRTSATRLLLDYIDDYLGSNVRQQLAEISELREQIAELQEFKERTEKILGELAA